jgi:hypothetical protein
MSRHTDPRCSTSAHRVWVTAATALVTLSLARSAAAQSALRGKRLYLDAARITGSGVSCVDCHGGIPGGLFGIGRAANDPVLVERAIGSVSQMAPFRGRLAANDFVDLAAYLGDPAVPSPQVELTVLPSGDPGGADRLTFGDVPVGMEATATVYLRNSGRLPFEVTAAPWLGGPNAEDFTLLPQVCDAGVVIAPAAGCSFELRFAPAQPLGMRVARLVIAHDWVGGVAAIALLGAATDSTAEPPAPGGCAARGGAALPFAVLLGAGMVWRRRVAGTRRR